MTFYIQQLMEVCAMTQNAPHILIADDNPEIREIIKVLLTGEGFWVTEAKNGTDALAKMEKQNFDLIILDIMMPGINGFETCQSIRSISNAPILFLSARTTDSDKMLGFSSGGDDYLEKPFSYPELIGRTKALIRRYHVYQGKENQTAAASLKQISCRGLKIDLDREEVYQYGNQIDLTGTEYEMLKLLVLNRRRIFSAQRLYEAIWQEPYYYGANNTVMVHIRNLRQKIEKDPKNPVFIKTAWGKGYHVD